LSRERGGHRILILREKVIIGEDLDYQNVQFLCQKVPYNEGVKIMFFFSVQTPKKIYLSPKKFLISGFGLVFHVFGGLSLV